MIPQIATIGSFPIHSFGLMIALAFFATVFVLGRSFRRNGIDQIHAESVVFLGGISGLVGARALYIWTFWSPERTNFFDLVFSSSGFIFFGGFIFAAIVLIIYARRHLIPAAAFMDSIGPAMALGYTIGRLGCQLSGDGDYGIATDSFWGMSYETGAVPTPPGVRVYPTPLFESVICLGILALLLRAEISAWWHARPYARFGFYLALISVERFIIEFIRVEPRYAYGFSQAQWTALILCSLGLLLLARGLLRGDTADR